MTYKPLHNNLWESVWDPKKSFELNCSRSRCELHIMSMCIHNNSNKNNCCISGANVSHKTTIAKQILSVIRNDDFEEFLIILRSKPDLNVFINGQTALHYCLLFGKLYFFYCILKQKLKQNLKFFWMLPKPCLKQQENCWFGSSYLLLNEKQNTLSFTQISLSLSFSLSLSHSPLSLPSLSLLLYDIPRLWGTKERLLSKRF